jgi:hypothetical protein
LVYSVLIDDLKVLQQWAERMSINRSEWNQEFWTECTPLSDEGLNVVLKYMGTLQRICCRDHMNIAHISAGICFWTYVHWECLHIYLLKAYLQQSLL